MWNVSNKRWNPHNYTAAYDPMAKKYLEKKHSAKNVEYTPDNASGEIQNIDVLHPYCHQSAELAIEQVVNLNEFTL